MADLHESLEQSKLKMQRTQVVTREALKWAPATKVISRKENDIQVPSLRLVQPCSGLLQQKVALRQSQTLKQRPEIRNRLVDRI